MKKILVTGAAGFIGYHLIKELLKENYEVIGIDNLNEYYDVNLKLDRIKQFADEKEFKFFKVDLVDNTKINQLFEKEKFDFVINLAAQAGVRYSIENPRAYINSNIIGFLNILEACKNYTIEHLIYASSSSVYGANVVQPFSENHNVDHPVSLYAASKKSNELMAHTYSNLYDIPTTGLRFFTVYGPWGRPDMAYFSFTKNIIEGNPIKIFNNGDLERDFTYIGDIISGIMNLIFKIPVRDNQWDRVKSEAATSFAPYRVFNIGNNTPVKLMNFISTLEELIGKDAKKEFLPMQQGDVFSTYADVNKLHEICGYEPTTDIKEGLSKFVEWYKNYYNIG